MRFKYNLVFSVNVPEVSGEYLIQGERRKSLPEMLTAQKSKEIKRLVESKIRDIFPFSIGITEISLDTLKQRK